LFIFGIGGYVYNPASSKTTTSTTTNPVGKIAMSTYSGAGMDDSTSSVTTNGTIGVFGNVMDTSHTPMIKGPKSDRNV
jgi:hypothetical protein